MIYMEYTINQTHSLQNDLITGTNIPPAPTILANQIHMSVSTFTCINHKINVPIVFYNPKIRCHVILNTEI